MEQSRRWELYSCILGIEFLVPWKAISETYVVKLDPISSITILNEKLIFSLLGFWNKLQNWSELTVALKSKLLLSGQLWLISRHRIWVRDTTVVLLEGLKKVWVWISGLCFAILYIHLHVPVWHWNPTLEQQSASFQQHNMPDQMSLATKSPAKIKSPVTFAVMGLHNYIM